MGKIWVEVCLISARGLKRTSSIWKLHWFAVGWIDPNNKYCTKVAASGNANPVWKTKFATLVDESKSNFQDLTLQVEVYSREPLFLRKKLHGSATVVLKEFLAKQAKDSEISRLGTEEVGSYQLRKRKSNKPQGFIDISIRISEDKEEPNSYPGNDGGFMLMDGSNTINLTSGSGQAYPQQLPLPPTYQPEKQLQTSAPYYHPIPFPPNYSSPPVGGPSYPSAAGPSYQPPRMQPPPPLPSNVGYVPTLLPRNDGLSQTYINMPSSTAGPSRGPGFGMGLGAGALAAGAVIFGDDIVSGFNVPGSLPDPTLAISFDPPF